MLKTLYKKSIEVYREGGMKGFMEKYRQHNLDYPPLRKYFRYWLYGKLSISKKFITQLDGYKMKLLYKDKGLSQQLFISKYREPECTRLVKKLVKPQMAIYDIGANMGYYVIMESTRIGKKGKVYAIEPSQENYKRLIENCELNKCSNIETYKMLIGNKTELSKLYISDKLNWCSVMKTTENYEEVSMYTFDEFIKGKEKPDFIRMDVEGYEYHVVDGMKQFLQSGKPCLMFMEVHPKIIRDNKLDVKVMYKKLFETGFIPTHIIKKHGWLREESVSFSDFYKALEDNKLTAELGYDQGYGLFLKRE